MGGLSRQTELLFSHSERNESRHFEEMDGIPSMARSDSSSGELCDAELGWQMCAEAQPLYYLGTLRWIDFSEGDGKRLAEGASIRRSSRSAFCQRVEDNAFHQYSLTASRLAGQTRKYENLSRFPGAVASLSAALG